MGMEITTDTTPAPATAEFLQGLEMALSAELGYGAILGEFDADDIDFVAATMTPAEAATWLLVEMPCGDCVARRVTCGGGCD